MGLLLRVVSLVQTVLCVLLEPLYWLYTALQTTIPLQPIRNPILSLSAVQLAEAIRSGQLSCEEVFHKYKFRSRRVDMKLNAIMDERYDEAVTEAEKVDDLIAAKTKSAKELEEEMPLLGVPITFTECCKVKGLSYTAGCKLRSGRKAEADGRVVELFRKAGAIPILVSNQSELGLALETNNLVQGLARNPYNYFRTVGGTSGGEAALVSSAGSLIGIGSDFNSSLRTPAMFTGIFGHKPTPGVVPLNGHHPGGETPQLAEYLTIGPLTRYAEDLPLVMKVMAGENANKLKLSEQVDIKDIKVLYMADGGQTLGLPSADKEIKRTVTRAVEYLGSTYDCNVQQLKFREAIDCPEICVAVLNSKGSLLDIACEPDPTNPKDQMNLYKELLKSIFRMSTYSFGALHYTLMKVLTLAIISDQTSSYIKQHENLKAQIIESLGDNGVLIMPTYPTSAHYHHQSLIRTAGSAYCTLVTSLGLPATNVPMGLNRRGMPIGLQVVAAPYQDRLCFEVARRLEKGFGGWIHPPSLKTPT